MASDSHSNDESSFPPPPESEDATGTAAEATLGAAPEASAAAAGAESAAGATASTGSTAGADSGAGSPGSSYPGAGGASAPPPPPPAGAPVNGVSQDDRTMALLCHLSGFLLFLVPLANIAAPMIIWLIKKDSSPFVDHHGKEALNFQINITFWSIVFGLLSMVLIGIPFLFLVIIADVVLTIVATVKASSGEHYSYPLTLRLVQ
jgi:uncharacterized Tic20 family protein